MKVHSLLLGTLLAGLGSGHVEAQDLSASGLLGDSDYGVNIAVSEASSSGRIFYRGEVDDFVSRAEISLPLNEDSREAAFVRDENLATGFRGYLFVGGRVRLPGGSTTAAATPVTPDDADDAGLTPTPDSTVTATCTPAAADGTTASCICSASTPATAPAPQPPPATPAPVEVSGTRGAFVEVGLETSFAYDRVEIRQSADLTMEARPLDSYQFEAGGRLYAWEQVDEQWVLFGAPRFGFRLQRAVTVTEAQVCLPLASNPMVAEQCTNVSFLEAPSDDTGDRGFFYARLGGGATVDVGSHRLGLYGEVASANLFTDATVSPRLLLFFAPSLSGDVGLLFGVGVQTQFETAVGTSTTTPYLLLGGQTPFGS